MWTKRIKSNILILFILNVPGKKPRIGDPHATHTRPAMLWYDIPLRPELTSLVTKLKGPLSFEEHFFSLSLT